MNHQTAAMMRPAACLAAFGAAALLFSCDSDRSEKSSGQPPAFSEAQSEELVRRGNEAAGALMASLSAQLKAALSSGPPADAVRVCQQIALPITESTAGQFEGVKIRRTALKVRNPKNVPDPADRVVLESWQDLLQGGGPLPDHQLVVAEGGARFYKPIMINSLCLKCHGASAALDPPLRELLDRLYPTDQALGYKEGDLRGAVRIDLKPGP